MIEACFCPANTPPGGEIVGHTPGTGGCENPPVTDKARLDEDPLLDIEIGEGEPFEISDDPCGARTITSLNEWNVVTCDRDPHPQAWLHVSICDDEVEHVWRDITPEELKLIVVSDEGVTFACCGWLLSLNGSHEDNCKVGGRDRREPEGSAEA